MDMVTVFLTWSHSLSSKNTYKSYVSSVNTYCNMVFNKDAIDLTEEDLANLHYSDTINKFVRPLRKRGVKDSTIKRHLIAMRSLLKMMRREKIYPKVNYSELMNFVVTVDNLKTKDVHHHDAISLKELDAIENFLRNREYWQQDEDLGEKYAMLVDFMYKTAIRVTATFNIKWSDFTLMTSPYGGDWAELRVIDKGKKLNTKYLTRKYYNHLMELFYDGNDDDRVFKDVKPHTLRNYFNEYSKAVGHKVVVHSLKAGAATTLYAETKDLILVRDFCDHESVKTTEAYIHTQRDPNTTGTAILTADHDYSKLDSLSKEQLLMLIHQRPEVENTVYMAAKNCSAIK